MKVVNYDVEEFEKAEDVKTRSKGIILNSKGEILLGYCGDVYQFPGGRLNEGEELIEGFLREVREETGMIVTEDEIEQVYLMTKMINGEAFRNNYFMIRTDKEPDVTNVEFDDYEEEHNYEIKKIKLGNVIDTLKESIKGREHNQTIVTEMIEVLSYCDEEYGLGL